MLVRSSRLRKQKDFDSVFQKGRFFQNDCLAVKFKPNQSGCPRFAVVVSAKTAKRAVVRNRLRRQLNEIIRTEVKDKSADLDIVIIVRPGLIGKKYQDIRKIFGELLNRAGLLKSIV